MNSNIKFWYEYTFKIAETIELSKQNGENMDGNSIWKNIEQEVCDVNIENLYYKKVDTGTLKDIQEKIKSKIQMKDILEIAYILGKLSILIKLNKLPKETKTFIEKNNLLDLDTYISLEDQDKINELYLNGTKLDKVRENIHILGGGSKEYYKYIKYKTKYFKLKNNIKQM
jgi:hypothetical protein